MDIFRNIQSKHIGPGSIHCPCCNNYHCRKDFKGKRAYRRFARRTLKLLLNVEINNLPTIY